ncbi:hypothetical protein PI23P_11072 [Polaribacter irgensii 23-P]|uniref:Uncharacterized protein n=1 Tax=Polaribacter irgensii 23-P TaxID=313594 RepID=A4C167_9FLAO|nr:hypothetical protein [Polaribacter irgensii]EAR11870.1 hypothetical protein PI23P_11072 [Polaribacter irgensii 23-P]
MKIAFRKSHLNKQLFYAVLFTLTGSLTFNSEQHLWHALFSIILPLLSVAKYFLMKHYKYLTVDKDHLKINDIVGKQVKISEINQIEKYAGKYILKTNGKKISIDTHIIEKKALIELNIALESLSIEWV